MRFSASLDTMAKVLSVATSLLLLLPLVMWRFFARGSPIFVAWGILALVLGIVLVSYALAPQAYSVVSGELRVHRSAGDKVFRLDQLTEVRRVEPREMRGTIRLWGNGGFFGYYGKFMNRAFGVHNWYATRRNNYVVANVGGKRIVLTPDEPDKLVQTLSTYVRNP